MKYDIAAKVALDFGKESILQEFAGIMPKDILYLEELPEETVSLKRSDFPLRVTLQNGNEIIVLIEVQTEFDNDFVLRLIDYTVRFKLKYHLVVIPLVLLLTKSSLATGLYEDDIIVFKYKIVRFWEMNAADFINNIHFYPFISLMNKGEDFIKEAENIIYNASELDLEGKADLLTAMAIFAGLKDKEIGIKIFERRRDIMIKSPVYDYIVEEARKEGMEEGIKEGMKEGIKEGMKEGMKEGKREGLYYAISLGLELKFGIDGIKLMEKVKKIDSIESLETIANAIKIAKNIEEIERLI